MTIEKIILNMATHYHANLIDMHNALHALGLRSDDQAEEFNKRYCMFSKCNGRTGTKMVQKWGT